MEQEQKRGPGRPRKDELSEEPTKRGEAMRTERRRRNTDDLTGHRMRLAVDKSKLDMENYEYRWINDTGERIRTMTQLDDWDIVEDRDGNVANNDDGMGAGVTLQSGGASGSMRSVLVRKRKDWYNDDKAAQQRRIDEQEAAMKAGAVPGGDATGTYVPDGKHQPMTLSVDHGSRS